MGEATPDLVNLGKLVDLPEGRGVRVEHAGHRVAVFRIGDAVHAIGDRCSHAEASLAEGFVYGHDVECPRHGSEFSLLSGEPDSLPAIRPVPVYPVEIIDGEVVLRLIPVVQEPS